MDSEERHTLVGVVSRKLFESNCNQVRGWIISKSRWYFLPLSPRRGSTPTWPSTSTGSRTRWKPTEEWQPALVFWVCRPRLVTFPFFCFCVVKNLTYTVSQKNALQNCHLLVKMNHSWPPDQSGIRELTSGCWWMEVLKLRFFWTPYISPPHTLLSLCYPVSFQASCKIAQYCSAPIAS